MKKNYSKSNQAKARLKDELKKKEEEEEERRRQEEEQRQKEMEQLSRVGTVM